MAIGFGNGGNLLINTATPWSASFQSIQPFALQAVDGDVTPINSPNGTLRAMIGSGRHAIQPQTASFFFNPETTEQPELTNGAAITECVITYPSGTDKNRKGTLYITGYQDGGLIDDEIMVGEITMRWQGGVPLSDITNVPPTPPP